jgi:GT2 family glycosyltransferase
MRVADLSYLLVLPLLAAVTTTLGVLLVVLDLLATPLVLLARRPASDERPRSLNTSIVVLNWNGMGFLEQLMPSLATAVQHCPGDHEVIVVDNGSDDGSLHWLRQNFPWARIVALPENLHFIRGNAHGAAAASRDLIVYLNNDMRVDPAWLDELVAPFRADDGSLFATTSRIEMDAPRRETGWTRGFLKHGEVRLVHDGAGEADDGTAVLWAGGGSSAFDRAKHDAIGGFETLYTPCYVEDVSLSWQAWRRGWHCRYAHRSIVHHAHRGSTSRVFDRRGLERLDWRNRELFFVRGVTDPRIVLTHFVWLPWNLRQRAMRRGLRLRDGFGALLATILRLPRALWMRQSSRRFYRRSDRAALRQVSRAEP